MNISQINKRALSEVRAKDIDDILFKAKRQYLYRSEGSEIEIPSELVSIIEFKLDSLNIPCFVPFSTVSLKLTKIYLASSYNNLQKYINISGKFQ